MEYKFIHNGNEITIETDSSGRITSGEESFEFEKDFSGENEFHALVNGEKKTFFVARDRDAVYVFLDGRQYILEETDSSGYGNGGTGGGAGGNSVSSPMPGTVIKINCSVGDEVEENDTLVIVEAMKMENNLRSPATGKVSKVNYSEGDLVEAGAPIVEIQPEE